MIRNIVKNGGSYGVNQNCSKDHVLVQLQDEEDQVRLALTPDEARDLIEKLQKTLDKIAKPKST